MNNVHIIEKIPKNMKKLLIYCHGFGQSKERIIDQTKILNDNNIGIIGFDFPCHGEDDNEFSLTNSIKYLDEVINYSKKYNVPISLMGSSYGGYIILSKINKDNIKFDKIFLKNPAVNFYECAKRATKIDIDYFDNHDYIMFLNNKKIKKEAFIEFMNDDLMKDFNKHDNDIYIIHGDKDDTVLLSDVEYFCNKNDIKLNIIKGANHGMKGYLDIVNQKLLNFLNK